MKKVIVEIADFHYELMCDENNEESLQNLCRKVNKRLLNIKKDLKKNIDNHYLLLLAILKMEEEQTNNQASAIANHQDQNNTEITNHILKSQTLIKKLITKYQPKPKD